ncbi:MTNB-like protein [Mya arenaria]|uniref:MTNB-like protein n=1 Tax=Mya arenaria TaxID=6604 RepID=A0ABY7DZ21_MYAAR|nr:MTNB-like protein [Mya arenaria]
MDVNLRDKICITPSGVQKERIHPEDLFVQTIDGIDLDGPPTAKNLKKSQCIFVFMHERDLKKRMAIAMEDYPESCAILARRHGVYVWGPTWEKAKTITEYKA